MRRWLLGITSFVLVLALLGACGNDDGGGSDGDTATEEPASSTAPAEYVDGLCAAVTEYQADLTEQNTAFQEGLAENTPSPEAAKTAIVEFLEQLTTRTEQLIADVEALGVPDVDGGEQVRTTLVGAFEKVVALFDEVIADIEALPADDPAALTQGFTELGTKLQEAGAEIEGSLEGFQSAELDEVAAEATSCQGVL